MDDLLTRCRETYSKIQEWRDAPDAFDLESDRLYLHDLVTDLQDEARQLGCQTESVTDPTIDEAFNVVASIINWCQSRDDTPSVEHLPNETTLKEWYTTGELATLMGMSEYTVREKWCNDGRIEAVKDHDANRWRIPGHEVKRLLNGGGFLPKRRPER